MIWLYPIILIIPNLILSLTDQAPVLAKITNTILPLGVFLLIMSSLRRVALSVLLCIPFMVYAAFQIVLLYLYGDSIIATDMLLSVVTSNPTEARELLGNLMVAIIVIFVVYLPPVIWATVCLINGVRLTPVQLKPARITAIVLTICGSLSLAACYIDIPNFTIGKAIFPVNVMRNTVEAVHRTYLTAEYPHTSDKFKYNATSSHDKDTPEIYLLVIGETSRAANWQLFGYDRQTTPRLSKRSDILPFAKTLTQSNTTHKTVPLMLSYLDASTYGDSIYNTKSIISAFNEAGYNTAFISTQHHNHSFIDYFAKEADISLFLSDSEDNTVDDFALIDVLNNFLSSDRDNKTFIVLHSYGSHFNYRDRYDANDAYFKPDDYIAAVSTVRNNLINAYDNSIRHTDCLLDSIINIIDNQNCISAVYYASDHGEDIFDDYRQRLLHSSPTPTYYQLHIPMILWMSPEMIARYPDKYDAAKANINKNVASTEALFHTIIDGAGIDTPYYESQHSLYSPTYTETRRLYIDDYNRAVPLNVSGLKNIDFKKLDQLEISYN